MFENGNYIFHPKEKAEIFNDFFVSQTCLPTAVATVPNLPRMSHRTISNVVVSEQEVANLLDHVNVTKACGPDGINDRMIQCCKYGLCKPFTRLLNTSLSLGQFSECWKLANVMPLSNYRTVSLLACLSKICEKLVFINLYTFLESVGFFYPFQSGFRPGDSTVMQLTFIVHKIYEPLDRGNEVRAVFLDISKAFDKVWHAGLLAKLKQLVEGSLFKWLESYLSNRMQCVVIEGSSFSWKEINAGVPQGSVLGPLLFLNISMIFTLV